MAIIYTYPVKTTPVGDDLILISDSADSNNTKQVKVSTLPGGSGSGVSSVTATSPVVSSGGSTPAISLTGLTGFGTTGQVIKVNSGADGLEWGEAGSTLPGGSDHSVQYKNGSTFDGGSDLTFHPTNNLFSVKHTVIVKGQGNGSPAGRLKLNCEQDSHAITLEGPAHSGGANYTLKFPSAAPTNNQILEYTTSGNLGWINTPASTAPQGTDGQFQYKNGSSFAGTDTLRFDADKIHMGQSTSPITRGQLVMYGDGTNASDIQLYNGGNDRFLKIAQQAGATENLTLTFPGVAPGGNNKILESDSSGQLSWINTPTGSVSITADNSSTDYVDIQVSPSPITGTGTIMADLNAVDGTSDTSTRFLSKDNSWDVPSYTTNTDTTYSAGTGLGLSGTVFSLASGAALTNLGGGSGTTYLKKDGTWATPSSTSPTVGHCSVDWADGCSSLATSNLIRFYRFTNSATFTANRGWIFITNNSGGGSETPLVFHLGIYSGSNMGTVNGLTLLGSGYSSSNPSTGLLGINLSAASGQSLALNSGSHYFLALMAQYANSSTAVAGKTLSSDIYTIPNTAGTLPTATSLPTSVPGESQSFGTNNISFACTLV